MARKSRGSIKQAAGNAAELCGAQAAAAVVSHGKPLRSSALAAWLNGARHRRDAKASEGRKPPPTAGRPSRRPRRRSRAAPPPPHRRESCQAAPRTAPRPRQPRRGRLGLSRAAGLPRRWAASSLLPPTPVASTPSRWGEELRTAPHRSAPFRSSPAPSAPAPSRAGARRRGPPGSSTALTGPGTKVSGSAAAGRRGPEECAREGAFRRGAVARGTWWRHARARWQRVPPKGRVAAPRHRLTDWLTDWAGLRALLRGSVSSSPSPFPLPQLGCGPGSPPGRGGQLGAAWVRVWLLTGRLYRWILCLAEGLPPRTGFSTFCVTKTRPEITCCYLWGRNPPFPAGFPSRFY